MSNGEDEKFPESFRRMIVAMAAAQKRAEETMRPVLETVIQLQKFQQKQIDLTMSALDPLAKGVSEWAKRIEQPLRLWMEQQQAMAEMMRRFLGPFGKQKNDKGNE